MKLLLLVLLLLILSSSSLKILSSFSKKIIKNVGISFISLSILTNSYSNNANAGLPFFSSQEQNMIDDIGSYQKPVSELLDDLRPTQQPNVYINHLSSIILIIIIVMIIQYQ
jgi:hypothetical protein